MLPSKTDTIMPSETPASLSSKSKDADDIFDKQQWGSKAPDAEALTPYFAFRYRLDRAAGCVLLVVASPLLLLLCLLVKVTSRGPALYRQVRVGLNGETFQIVKLRSMVHDAEKDGKAVWCTKHDARVTPVGKLLRALHLDELPQLINVARGEMSLVGPRPERPEICEDLAAEIDGYYRRVLVKPGVTGLAQINLPPDETLEDAMRKQVLDLCYIDQANAWLDFRMLIATLLRMFGIKGETVIRAMRLCRRDLIRENRFETVRRQAPAPAPSEWDAPSSPVASYALSMASVADTRPSKSIAVPRRPR